MKKYILLFALISCAFSLSAQNTFYKLMVLEPKAASRFTSVLPTDSCYFVIGTLTDSFIRAVAFWGKIDLNGDLQILKTFRHPQRDYFNDFGDLRSTPEGLLYNIGQYNDAEPSTQTILFLYNQQGDTLLTRQYRSVLYPVFNFVVATSVIQKTDGGFTIVSAHQKNQDYTNTEISLLLVDSVYQVQHYLKYASSPLHETPYYLLLDDDGGFIIGADRSNTGQVNGGYKNRTLIIKTDSAGQQLWQYLSPEGVLQDEAKAMLKTPDGGLVVASGMGTESNSNPNYHVLYWDAMIFKLDSNRNVVWQTPFRGDLPTGSTELNEIVEATDGSGYVASGVFGEVPSPDVGYHTSWLVKVSPQGDSLWARRYTYFDDEFVAPEVYDMKATPDGGYVLVGVSRNVGIPIPAFIMKVDSFGCLIPGCQLMSSAEEPEAAAPALMVYPNPVTEVLNFQVRHVPSESDVVYRVIDVEGKIIKETGLVNVHTTVTMPVSGWPGGTYWLQCLERGAVIGSTKFVKL